MTDKKQPRSKDTSKTSPPGRSTKRNSPAKKTTAAETQRASKDNARRDQPDTQKANSKTQVRGATEKSASKTPEAPKPAPATNSTAARRTGKSSGMAAASNPRPAQISRAAAASGNRVVKISRLELSDLSALLKQASSSPESSLRTSLSVGLQNKSLSLFVPPDMPSLQPAGLRWLSRFARNHAFRLLEDRRQVTVSPVQERRRHLNRHTPMGLAMLLCDTGLPGSARRISTPNRLGAGNPAMSLPKLIQAASLAQASGKHVQIDANPILQKVLPTGQTVVQGHACKLLTSEMSTIASYFHTDGFQAIGYATGGQYVLHVLLGGGALGSPKLWCDPRLLPGYEISFQVFRSPDARHDVGLLYTSYFLDLQDAPSPWWIDRSQPRTAPAFAVGI